MNSRDRFDLVGNEKLLLYGGSISDGLYVFPNGVFDTLRDRAHFVYDPRSGPTLVHIGAMSSVCWTRRHFCCVELDLSGFIFPNCTDQYPIPPPPPPPPAKDSFTSQGNATLVLAVVASNVINADK